VRRARRGLAGRPKSRVERPAGEPVGAPSRSALDALPDVRDGLTPLERAVLVTLEACQREAPGRAVPTALLYGRLCERFSLGPEAFVAVLARLSRRRGR
jgi:hypothetical protein